MEKLSNYSIKEKVDHLEELQRAYEKNVNEMNGDFRAWLTRNFEMNEMELACIKRYPDDFWKIFGEVTTIAMKRGAKVRSENISDTGKDKELSVEVGYDFDDKRVYIKFSKK